MKRKYKLVGIKGVFYEYENKGSVKVVFSFGKKLEIGMKWKYWLLGKLVQPFFIRIWSAIMGSPKFNP